MAVTSGAADFAETDLRSIAAQFIDLYWQCRRAKTKSDVNAYGTEFSSNLGDIVGSDSNGQRLISGNSALGVLYRLDDFLSLMEQDQPVYAAVGAANGRLDSFYPMN